MRRGLVLLTALFACGGQTNEGSDASIPAAQDAATPSLDVGSGGPAADASLDGVPGAPIDAGVADTFVADGNVTDASSLVDTGTNEAAPPPPVGTPECQDQPCILCSDGYYHCIGGSVYSPCPANLDAGASCTGTGVSHIGCFSCASNGQGDLWQCLSDGGWNITAYDCTP